MKDYNFDQEDGDFGETRRLDDINQEIKEIVNKKQEHRLPLEEELGDSNAFLDNFESETFYTKPLQGAEEEEEDWELQQADVQQRRLKVQISIAALLSMLLFIAGFYLVRSGISAEKHKSDSSVADKKVESTLLVKAVTDNAEFLVHDIEQHKNYTIHTGKSTLFYNRQGQKTNISEFSAGDMISVTLDDDEQVAKSVVVPPNVWIKTQVSGLEVDEEKEKIMVRGEEKEQEFLFSKDTLFLYGNKMIEPEELVSTDVLEFQGKGNKIWSVKVMEYHGYLSVKNIDKIQDGKLQIDGQKESMNLEEVYRVPIPQGSHEIIITGSNIETRTEKVFIVAEEEKNIDLSVAQSKTSVLIFQCPVPDFKLYINGTETDGVKPVVLPQGNEYDIVILANGYKQWNQKITLDQSSYTIDVDLEPEILRGTVQFQSDPEGAFIYINNVAIGMTPIQKELEYGTYRIMVELDGYEISNETISVSKPSDTIHFQLIALDEE